MSTKAGDEIPTQCLGETGALSFKKPTEQDQKDTQELEGTLSQLTIFETAEEMSQRREALMRLQDISNQWIRQKAIDQNLPTHVANATTGKIFTFGSYRLGVNFQGADIDSLLVVPRFITREEFFADFQAVLTENPHVEDIHAVVDAFVPVLKMKFMGVEVIRIWAKRRNIYSNALGFLGGVSWAILVSRISQLYPYATPSMIVYLFFKIFSQWPWPKPVRLRECEYIQSLSLPIWDPRLNPPDQYHLMPILTPSYPSQNSTYNVQRSNRIIIERELKYGLMIAEDALMHKQSWSYLFEAAFFFHYRHYVVVVVTGSVRRAFMELCGLVESRLRVLVSNFEMNRYVRIAHVNCHSYGKGPSDEDAELVRKWFIGMEFDRNPNSLTNLTSTTNAAANPAGATEKPALNVDLSDQINQFEKSIERGLSNDDPTNSVSVKYVKKSQLSQLVSAEEMEEIKQQAAAYAKSTTNRAQERLRNSNRTTSSPDSIPTSASASDLLTKEKALADAAATSATPPLPSTMDSPSHQLNAQRSSSCASLINLTLSTDSPASVSVSDSVDSPGTNPKRPTSPLSNGDSTQSKSSTTNSKEPAITDLPNSPVPSSPTTPRPTEIVETAKDASTCSPTTAPTTNCAPLDPNDSTPVLPLEAKRPRLSHPDSSTTLIVASSSVE